MKNGTGKTIALGDSFVPLIDNGADPLHADLVTEARQYNGTFALGFGAIILDANNEPEVRILSRIRLNVVAAQTLHSYLGGLIAEALKPADTSKAN